MNTNSLTLQKVPKSIQKSNPDFYDSSAWLCNAVTAASGKFLFQLDDAFVDAFRTIEPPFGFNGVGELVYLRTYSRVKEDGSNETWVDTVRRVVEGVFEALFLYTANVLNKYWDKAKNQAVAQDMFQRIFNMKFLPPGRGLWAMGTAIVRERGCGAALNNCAFVSTQYLAIDPTRPFTFLMDAAMLGVGVGFDTLGAGLIRITKPLTPAVTFIVPDTREGWVDSIKQLLTSYFVADTPTVTFDYSEIRPAGILLKTFGGYSSGEGPLRVLHESVQKILDASVGQRISIRNIVDIMNLIGKCVISGNVRRTAEIAFGDPTSQEFLDLKNYEKNPERGDFGWTSNNSIFATLGMDYTTAAARIQDNGEPGFAWLYNMRAYSRMGRDPDDVDHKVDGGNPCLEQSLEHMELCCLVETFPNHHETLKEFQATLTSALLYAKAVTLISVHWPETREVMNRNRRIGCSVSGIAQFIAGRGIETLRHWLNSGYQHLRQTDNKISEMLNIPRSIKLTSVKPSGSVSLLAGATPGLHYPESRFYIRRVGMPKTFHMVPVLIEHGYTVVPKNGEEQSAVICEFPVKVGDKIREVGQVSMWEQLSLAAFMQEHWADNQVSATVTFDPRTEGAQLAPALDFFQYKLKGISFLPRHDYGAFPQMPYEAISEEVYLERSARIRPLSHVAAKLKLANAVTCEKTLANLLAAQDSTTHRQEDAFCDGDKCTARPPR